MNAEQQKHYDELKALIEAFRPNKASYEPDQVAIALEARSLFKILSASPGNKPEEPYAEIRKLCVGVAYLIKALLDAEAPRNPE